MKSLVIYFSHVGENYMKNGIEVITKGNSEIVAEKVASLINGDLFKVEEKDAYPFNYKECCDKAKEDLESNKRLKLKNYIRNQDKYDEFIIVGPVWWGHYPIPLLTQLEMLDFHNKKVKFIATHEGSRLGNTPLDIKHICKGALISNGLAIFGHAVNESDEEIKKYLGV